MVAKNDRPAGGPAAGLGELIARLRQERGLSQRQLATRAGVAQQTLQQIEHGAGAHWETVRRLARGLRLSLGHLDRLLPEPADGAAEPAGRARLSDRDKAEIGRRAKAGEKHADLAHEFHCTPSYVSKLAAAYRDTRP